MTLALLILPLLDGVEEAIGVGVLVIELVMDAVVAVGVAVVFCDSQRPTRFIICGDMPGRFLPAVWSVCVCVCMCLSMNYWHSLSLSISLSLPCIILKINRNHIYK